MSEETNETVPDSPAVDLDLDSGGPGAPLAEALQEMLREELTPGVGFAVLPHPNGQSLTLACATGVRLADVENPAAASLLLELCETIDDSSLRIGVEGEFDAVHLYRLVLTEGLETVDLVTIAGSMSEVASGLQQLLGREVAELVPRTEGRA